MCYQCFPGLLGNSHSPSHSKVQFLRLISVRRQIWRCLQRGHILTLLLHKGLGTSDRYFSLSCCWHSHFQIGCCRIYFPLARDYWLHRCSHYICRRSTPWSPPGSICCFSLTQMLSRCCLNLA